MAQQLDRETVEAIYRRYGAAVERCCRRILRNEEEALDAAQEVFLKLFTRGGDFRGEAEWMTWLYKVSVNHCLTLLSKANNQSRLLERHGDPVRPGMALHPAMLEDRDTLQMLLAGVDHKTQQIVIHYYLHEMGQEEIGNLMNLSRVSVNKRLRSFEEHAQALLREGKAT